MQDFLLLFRSEAGNMSNRSPEEMQASTQKWMDWIGGIAARGHLVDRGNPLTETGRVVKPGLVTDGPYSETKEVLGGYTLIRAETYEDAVAIAQGCPVLLVGGNVEVRTIAPLIK